jgi:hypothetical protein
MMLTDSLDGHMKPNHRMTWATYHQTHLNPEGQPPPTAQANETKEAEQADTTDEVAILRELYNREWCTHATSNWYFTISKVDDLMVLNI